MTLIKQRSTEREEIPEGPPMDKELRQRCRNVHDFYTQHVPDYLLKGVHYPKTFEELVEIIRKD